MQASRSVSVSCESDRRGRDCVSEFCTDSIVLTLFLVTCMPDAGMLATILLIVGLFLLGLEFFIPSFGIIGTLSAVSLMVSLWSANKAWGDDRNPAFFYAYLAVLIAGVPGTIFGAFYVIQNTRFGRQIILQPPEVPLTPKDPLAHLIGRTGFSKTLLTPGGIVTVDGVRFHAESTGLPIEPETRVVVVASAGNRIVVRIDDGNSGLSHTESESRQSGSAPAEKNSQESTDARRASEMLDFEIPKDYMT
jgi:membrane-bound ClpP family serine protease